MQSSCTVRQAVNGLPVPVLNFQLQVNKTEFLVREEKWCKFTVSPDKLTLEQQFMQLKPTLVALALIILPEGALSQVSRSQADLARLQLALDNAKKRVVLNEKKIAAADSTIEAGQKLIDEAKAEIKSIDSGSKTYQKEYNSKYKAVKKLTGSKDKTEAKKASTDLKALEAEYHKTDNGFVTRMNNAYKKQSAGASVINRGMNAKAAAKEALKAAGNSLKAAQEKYDAAAAPPKGTKGK
jgi:hypothetical protein